MNACYEARIQRVIQNMEREGIPQILVTGTASVYYLTGVWVSPMERLFAFYLDTDGRQILFGNDLFGLQPSPGRELYVHNDSDDPLRDLARLVKPGIIGIDKMWPSRFLISLLQKRSDLKPVLGSAPVDEARMRKDAEEIEALRHASRVNDSVVAAAIGAVREGAVESQLAAFVEEKFREAGAGHGHGQLVCFGANAADPHHDPNTTVIQDGDCVVFDIFIPVPYYWCDMTRTVFFRSATDEAKRVYETVREANLAAEAVIRPGVPLSEFDHAARAVIEKAGYGPYFTHRLGHGIGLECHEPPDNSASSTVIAEPGMVFSVEPGIYLPGKLGVRIEDLVLVTETGCEVLNAYTKDLQIVG